MDFEQETKELAVVKSELKKKFEELGYDKLHVDVKMNALDCEFLVHSYVNTDSAAVLTIKDRLKYYLEFLKIYNK